MNCLCCGKPLKEPFPISGWHDHCVRRFFGTKALPDIELTADGLQQLVISTVNKGYTVPGVQKKLSLHLTKAASKDEKPRLTLVNYPTGYILKPPVDEYPFLPEAEQMAMHMADAAGIQTVPHALIRLNGQLAYITKRVDRVTGPDGELYPLAMEDFCQLDLKQTQDKYHGSYERCGKVISRYSSRSPLDLTELFNRLVFCFLIGNSDMHLKNFSLIETEPQSGLYVISPAYDMVPVNVILPEDVEEFALTMNGKKTRLRRKDFLAFAETVGITQKTAEAIIARMLRMLPKLTACCDEALVPEMMKASVRKLIEERAGVLASGK